MKMRYCLMVILLSLSLCSIAQENGVNEGIIFLDNQPWTEVLKQAAEQDKLIFMDCYTVWCGPCKGLSKNVFPQKKMGDFFNPRFINVKYDMEKGDGKMLYEKYKKYIIGFPTLLLINKDGEVIHQMAGYHEADDLIEGIKAGMEGRSLFAMQKKYESGDRDFETMKDYVDALEGAFQRDKIKEILEDYLQTLPNDKLLDKEVWNLVGNYVRDPYSEAYRFVFKNIDKYQYRLGVDRYALERQLGDGMASAVKNIIEVSSKSSNTDSLEMMKQYADTLKLMLNTNNVKNFPTLSCKLAINDARLRGDVMEVYRKLKFADEIHLLNYEGSFRKMMYSFVINNTKDKKLLTSCLNDLILFQKEEDNSSLVLMNQNYYDVLATLYIKLGKNKEAKEAEAKYNEIEQAQKNELKKFFPQAEDEQ